MRIERGRQLPFYLVGGEGGREGRTSLKAIPLKGERIVPFVPVFKRRRLE